MRLIRITLILTLLLPYHSLSAQNKAKDILDKTAKIVRKSGDMEVNFTAASFMEQKEKGNLSGTIYLKGKKFNIVSTNVLCWYDGKTLWSMNKATNEVNVSTPSQHEKETMDPYLFLDLYKKGYTYEMQESTLRGRDCYEITLKATDPKQEVREMIVSIDKATQLPLCVRMREGIKYWVRISILKCKVKQSYDDDLFTFKSENYPKATVIDIR
ncbi:MAG: hypothetical protein ILA34_03350 [Bacteroidaceae bacterium]|nr:hypothetical protein [Bacteroidaceae bacterium]